MLLPLRLTRKFVRLVDLDYEVQAKVSEVLDAADGTDI